MPQPRTRRLLPWSVALTLVLALPALAAPPDAKSDTKSDAPSDAKSTANEADAATVEASPSTGVFPYPVARQKLENGLEIVVVPMPSPGLVSYRTVVRTGARDEYEKGHTGFAHFFEHMMFRGTQKYPADVYNEIVTSIGADSNAYTSTDVTVYQFDIAAEDLEQVMDIESDRFMNLSYAEADFQTEAGAVYGEYRKNRANPGFLLYESLHKAAFDRHTYGHTAMGYEADIKAMPGMYEYSRKFFERYYRPENCALIVAGDVDPSKVFAMAERFYGPWKKGYVPPKVKKEPKQKKERRLEVEYPGRTLPRIAIAYKGDAFAPDDPVWVASIVLADLAFGETSEIHKELVLESQSVQYIGASPATDRDPGLWSINAMVNDAKEVDAVLARIDQAVAKYREVPVSAERLDRVKSNLKYGYLMGLDTPAAVAGDLASTMGITGDPLAVDRLYATLEKVTPADIQAAAKKYLDPKQRTVAILRSAPEPKKPTTDGKAEKGGAQ